MEIPIVGLDETRQAYLARTNDLPSSSERSIFLQELQNTQERLDKLDEQIARLSSQRWQISCRLGEFTEVVSPIRRLSRDLIYSILTIYIEDERHNSSSETPLAPWIASWVCKAWREVVLSMRWPWCLLPTRSVGKSLPGVSAHLERSIDMPLHVNLLYTESPVSAAVGATLVEHSRRWEILLTTQTPGDTFVDVLLRMDINATSLRRCLLYGRAAGLLWLLQRSTVLEEATLILTRLSQDPMGEVVHKSMKKLSLCGFISIHILNRLILPNLLDLSIDSGPQGTLPIGNNIQSFLARTSPPLTSLKLLGGFLTDGQLIDILRHLPKLTKLSIQSIPNLQGEYIEAMIYRPRSNASSSRCLVPHLRDASLPLCEATVELVLSRSSCDERSDSPVAKLQQVHLQVISSRDSDGLMERLMEVTERGVKIYGGPF